MRQTVSNQEPYLASSHKRQNDTKPRVLFFHTGTWKTGSTALQAHLNNNKSILAEAGISYEFPSLADLEAGNGGYLSHELFDRQLPRSTLDSILEDYFAGRRVAICSSEDFTKFRTEEWEQILDASRRLASQVRTITYVRDVGPYYASLHAQSFKAGEHYCDLREFCAEDCYRTVLDSLKGMHDLFGREAMTVVHYESVVNGIDVPFMAALSTQPDDYDRSMLARRSNRSFTQYEMEVLRKIIKKTGRQFAEELAILLLRRRPDLQSDRTFDFDLVEQLRLRHQGDVSWLNRLFFAEANVVKILADTSAGLAEGTLSSEIRHAIDGDIFDWCISKFESAQQAGVAFIAQRLTAIDWRSIGNPTLPEDFDPIAYLLLNLDVMRAGVPPCEHYITSGQFEKGRRWRWETR
jgi:hypothetical protein